MRHIIQTYLTLNNLPPTDSRLPSGWKRVLMFIEKIGTTYGAAGVVVTIKNGTLYTSAAETPIEPGQYDIWRRLCISASVESSVTCMMCGFRGQRRKDQDGYPPLCWKHYVEYVNALDERPPTTAESLNVLQRRNPVSGSTSNAIQWIGSRPYD